MKVWKEMYSLNMFISDTIRIKIIINDFSADVHDGQKIAIVGPTGAGKTTMIKLLMRFYDVNSGVDQSRRP